ncbi:unnamed protein product [Clonostachys rosea f. rosea IK726]|uniref:lytic cellulose monooxygenase (C4-dehydrogenating) n=2 Tax=Bionectria ochroleuca TaxID=29856 RepID=A0A0B7KQB6_BIOOC|nr:unnamed protein product [Clonostachys rosea f. rosea IK726]
MKISAAILGLVSLGQAHYHFHTTIYNDVASEKFEFIREIDWNLRDGPELDVFGPNMTCNRMNANPFTEQGTKVLEVTAGSTIDFEGYIEISHPGPLQFFLAKAPSGTKVEEFDGLGDVWFKIYSDGDESSIIDERLTWPNWKKNRVSIKIPECVADGEYLLRLEHIALHNASQDNGAQFYISCAQIRVTGGTGTLQPSPSDLLAFPGSYDPKDPGLFLHIWYPIPTSYTAPGGPVLQC